MGKASRTKVDATRREKIAAQRAAERRAEQRRRILIASGSIIVVIAVVVAFIVIKANNKPATNASNGPTGSALASVVSKVTNIPAFTFHGSSYTSKYLTFTPVEMQTNVLDQSTGQYPVLEKPTAAQQALLTKYDAAPYTTQAGAIPFIYFGGKYLSIGATYDP